MTSKMDKFYDNFCQLKSAFEQVNCLKTEINFNEKLLEFVQDDSNMAYTVLSEIYQVLEKLLQLLKDSKTTTCNENRKLESESNMKLSKERHVIKSDCSIYETRQKKVKIDSSLVQIKADKAEVDRRIAAFIEKKQVEVDDLNIREFCNLLHTEPEKDTCSSCARTDAVFVPRVDSKSHVKVSRVLNQYGPQTRLLHYSPSKRSHGGNLMKQELRVNTNADVKDFSQKLHVGLSERIKNLEGHIGVGSASEKNIFKRVKCLEERVLHLESLSPEYFSFMPDVNKQHKSEKARMAKSQNKYNTQTMNVQEIEDKISVLKQKLSTKDIKLEPS